MYSYNATAKVLLIEDHPIVRNGVMPYIKDMAEEVEIIVAETLASAISILRENGSVSLIIVDITLPDGNGLDILHHQQELGYPAPAVVLSATDDVDMMKQALNQGAKGFITKNTAPELMVHALRMVHAGGVYVPEQLVNSFLQSPKYARNSNGSSPYRGLTHRQLEVLRLLTNSHSNKEIALQLHCAESTVKAHVTAVLKALGVANRGKAAEAAKNLQWAEDSTQPLALSS